MSEDSLKLNYIIDYTTTNDSFIRVYQRLKEQGVKNNKFFLRLFDRDLQNIDPFDPSLSVEMKTRIRNECIINPWYFFREVVRHIPVPGGTARFELHLGNLAFLFLTLQNINTITVLPRQHYKTVTTVILFNYILEFSTVNSKVIFSNKSGADACLNLERFNENRRALPQYLVRDSKEDLNNKTYRHMKITNNKIDAMAPGNDETGADRKGRGMTVPFGWWDEFSFIKYIAAFYESATMALSEASRAAKRNNKPFAKIITTTPNMLDIPEGAYCKMMINDSAKFISAIYDMSEKELELYVKYNSKNDFIYIEFSYIQLGKDEEWLNTQKRALNNNLLKIKREIFLTWPLSNERSVFEEEVLEEINRICKYPIKTIQVPNTFFYFDMYEYFDPTKNYIIGMDIATGLKKDFSTMVVIDPVTLNVIATFGNNNIKIPSLVELVELVCELIFPNAYLAIERSSVTLGFIDTLLKNPKMKPKILYTYSSDDTKEAEKVHKDRKRVSSSLKNSKTKTKVYGVPITTSTRSQMVEMLLSTAEHNKPYLAYECILNDLKGLEVNRDGKIEHSPNTHDDYLFGWLYAVYALRNFPSIAKLFTNTGSIANRIHSINTMSRATTQSNSAEEFLKSRPDLIINPDQKPIHEVKPAVENINSSNRNRPSRSVIKSILDFNRD